MFMVFIPETLAVVYPHRDLTRRVREHSLRVDAGTVTAYSYRAVLTHCCLLFWPLLPVCQAWL